jgi:hypothetical protein
MARTVKFLFYPPPVKKAGVGRVLLDVGGLTLLSRILNAFVTFRSVLSRISVRFWTLVALIAGRDGWHVIVIAHRRPLLLRQPERRRLFTQSARNISALALPNPGTIVVRGDLVAAGSKR